MKRVFFHLCRHEFLFYINSFQSNSSWLPRFLIGIKQKTLKKVLLFFFGLKKWELYIHAYKRLACPHIPRYDTHDDRWQQFFVHRHAKKRPDAFCVEQQHFELPKLFAIDDIVSVVMIVCEIMIGKNPIRFRSFLIFFHQFEKKNEKNINAYRKPLKFKVDMMTWKVKRGIDICKIGKVGRSVRIFLSENRDT